MFTTHPRVTGVTERVAYAVLMFFMMKLVKNGYITPEMAEYIALGVIGGAGALYAWWINRPQKIIEAAASVPNPGAPTGKTVIVTTPELANATPAANVVSSDVARVVGR